MFLNVREGVFSLIKFKNVSKVYGNNKAVDNISLDIERGSFVSFIGTSGSGKTTSMRMINKMVRPSSGTITLDGKDLNSFNDVSLRRSIGYVIQSTGLMPHMTIYENIVMVPTLLGYKKEEKEAVARDLIQRVDLSVDLLNMYPGDLSGGMQQRVGVIRALAASQDIILMDEPFGALDPITRDSLQVMVKRLQRELEKTIIFVTHDMDEALKLSDKIVIMDHGKIVQDGTPEEILTSPANDFVKELIGEERLNQAVFEYKPVEEIMINPIKINQNSTVGQAAYLMRTRKIDDILVIDDKGVLVGRVDLLALMDRNKQDTKVSQIMKKVTYIQDTTTIRDAIYYVQDLGYRNLSVVDEDGVLVGIVTRAAIVDTLYEAFWQSYEPVYEEDDVNLNEDKVDAAIELSLHGDM